MRANDEDLAVVEICDCLATIFEPDPESEPQPGAQAQRAPGERREPALAHGDPETRTGRWPVDTFDELVDALGPSTTVVVHGREVPLAQAERLVPAYYFPVVSAADLDSKLADLRLQPADQDMAAWALGVEAEREDAGGWS